MDLYYVTTPIYVIDSDLGDGEKIVLGILMSLSTKEGYCYAKNDYLALKTNKNEDAVKKIISRLKQYGIIRVEEVSRKNRERKIYINDLKKLHEFNKKTYAKITSAPSVEPQEPEVQEQTTSEDRFAKFAPKKAKTATTITINNINQFTLTPRMSEFAQKQGFNEAETANMFEHFLSHHASKGSTFKDWDMAFNTWCHNAKGYQSQKKFSNAHARGESSSLSPAQRIMTENMLLEDHARIESLLIAQGIFMNRVTYGEVELPLALAHVRIVTMSTLKKGTQKIWFDSQRWANINTYDIITVEAIEHKAAQ
jgi:hypothetical protein